MSATSKDADARAVNPPAFNFEFPLFLIICALLSIFFLLYFNRVFSSIVSYAIRAFTWHRYKVYVDVKALQISLLGGRVLFTGLRYHGSNETFLVQHGSITWRYWLRRVRKVDIRVSGSTADDAAVGHDKNVTLPCRINVKLVGFEWFVYNRSSAYERILAGISGSGLPEMKSGGRVENKDGADMLPEAEQNELSVDASVLGRRSRNQVATSEKTTNSGQHSSVFNSGSATPSTNEDGQLDDAGLPFLLQLFPIHVDCHKPAVVVGNETTKAILIVKANSASTDVDASATSTCDQYRQTFKVHLEHPIVEMKENKDFKEDLATRATRQQADAQGLKPPLSRSFVRRNRRKVFSSLRNMVLYWRRSVESFSTDSRTAMRTDAAQIPGASHWKGLSRYLDEQYQDDKSRWSSVEYGAALTILDSPAAKLIIYWDVVSRVTSIPVPSAADINGNEPPEWGMSLSVKGGTMNYGSWADRHRANLQRVFFPSLAKDVSPASALSADAWRVATCFTLFVELEDTATFRIPTREDSKNWRWRGKEPPTQHHCGPTKRKQRSRAKRNSKGDAFQPRPAGWLEIKVPANSTVEFSMDMLAGLSGFKTRLNIDLPSTEIWSSVNHDFLWRSGAQRISCDLGNPLSWNALRQWHFTVDCTDLELFLLRDHVFLLTDLVSGWASGPPPEYLAFTPFKYHLHLSLRNPRLYLNVNDENIIDNATAIDENSFLILSSPLLNAETTIPLDRYRPSKNAIPFDIRTDSADLTIHFPQSSTQAAFLPLNELGHVDGLVVNGSYQYNSTTSPANIDTLVLKVHGQSPYAQLYGFVIRYFLLLKDNYFGDHTHFKTLDEYQAQLRAEAKRKGTGSAPRPPRKQSNDIDVILSIRVDNPRVMLPTNLYSADRFVQCELADLSVDLRFTNYFMDLELALSPLSLSVGNRGLGTDSASVSSSTQLFVDGLRIFGHRTFGLPPSEPTYLCNWDLFVGAISGECTADFLATLIRAGTTFIFTFDDVENALVPYSSLVFHDITFVRASVDFVRLWFHVDNVSILLSTDTIEVKSNDWARSHYSKRAEVSVPGVQLSCVNAEAAARHISRRHHPPETMAYLKTDVRLATIGRKYHFTTEREIQQSLVLREDQRTKRVSFLLLDRPDNDFVPEPFDPPAQCFPMPPFPVTESGNDGNSCRSTSYSWRSQRSKSQGSFLSSSDGSIRDLRSRDKDQAKSRLRRALLRPDGISASDTSIEIPGLKIGQQSTSKPAGETQYMSGVHDHSSVAFSSQYCAPYFPLESVRPECRDVVFPAIREDSNDDMFSQKTTTFDDIDPRSLSEDHAYASILFEFPSGITACLKPEAVHHAASLLAELRPSDPESILDSLQVGVMNEVFKSKTPEHHRKIQDLLVRLPRADVRLLNPAETNSPNDAREDQDQYDMRISKAVLVTRTVTEVAGTDDARTSLHFRMKSAELSASERPSSLYNPQAAVLVEVDDVTVSLGARDVTYFDADIGSVVSSTASANVEYLASLMHRTGILASNLESLISTTIATHRNRVKYLTYRLVTQDRSTNDPAFLTRPSAVLRSVPQHVRTCDSWKLVMRLRQIWATLRTIKSSLLTDDCKNVSCLAPPDAAEAAVVAFQRWRSWDLEDAGHSVLIARVFGRDAKGVDPETGNDITLLGACRLADLRFVLDPGPKQNNVGLVDITIRVEQKPAGSKELDFDGPLTVCNLCCSDAALHFNWELCELADGVLRLYSRNLSNRPDKPKPTKYSAGSARVFSSTFHVVLELMRGSVDLETVNLGLKISSNEFKASILVHNTGEHTDFASVLLDCSAVTSRLHSHSQILGTYQLRRPSIFASYELQETEEAILHSFKLAGSCQDLVLAIKQDPIVLLETMDLAVKDEVAQLHRFQGLVSISTRASEPAIKMMDRLSSVKINVAMFLDSYNISVLLLQSLTYKISGNVARIACAANYGQEVILDFDVKENSHGMQIYVRNKPQNISLLQIPSVNGRITSQTSQFGRTLTVLSSIEIVQLDASAIYSILAALNRPQISSTIREIQQQTKTIRCHIAEIFGLTKPHSPEATQAPRTLFIYNLHLSLSGLRIFTKATLASKTEPIAQVLFSLDKTHFLARNQRDSNGPSLRYPDLHVTLRQIGLDVLRGRKDAMRSCGSMRVSVTISASSSLGGNGREDWRFHLRSNELDINLSPETVSTVIDVIGHSSFRVKDLDTSRELEYLRKLRRSKPHITIMDQNEPREDADLLGSVLASVVYQFELRNIRMCWNVADESGNRDHNKEDFVLSIQLIEFGTKTRKSARLTIEQFLLQTVPPGQDKDLRSLHSALLPKVIFKVTYVSTAEARRMAFQATGESLDLRLTSAFIMPAAKLVESISLSMWNVRKASAQWTAGTTATKKPDEDAPAQRALGFLANKRLESLLIDADFAGAVVYVSGKNDNGSRVSPTHSLRLSLGGRYGQFNADDSGSAAVLRTPGLAWKAEYRDSGHEDSSLYGEVKIDASSNILYPEVVPLVLDIISSVREVVSTSSQDKEVPYSELPKSKSDKAPDEDNILTSDTSAVLGRLRLNLGLRICRQEFSLSCQPVARVAAIASFDSVYFMVNTATSQEQGNFFAISGTLAKTQASVQHVYSRESTASFGVETVTLSFMNSKHVSGTSGVSAILKVSPMSISVNAKQVQDFLLFREIWYPEELRRASLAPVAKLETETSQGHLFQRYQQVASTTAFPWTATISIASLDLQIELGQAIGSSVFQIGDFWVSAKKTSNWDQNLCLRFQRIGIDCTGRLSGFVALQDLRLRTSIQWPKREEALNETPLIQASLAFNSLRVKAAFDYQAFLVADITAFEFLMYNVRERREGSGERLVAIFDGDAVQVFGTTASAAQVLALFQAMQKLVQERKENFELSLREIERFTRRKSSNPRHVQLAQSTAPRLAADDTMAKSPISLDTDVVVTLKTLNLGVFPSTFSDHQVFKMEALNVYARFVAGMKQRRIHSILRMTLGQLRIGLAGVRNAEAPKTLSEMTVEDVVQRSTGSRGGTILKVPRVEAVMETWQRPKSNQIDYVFKSAFEGKVEVGWNYSRISYIRGMWANHTKVLEQTWGRQLPMTAVKITGIPQAEAEQQEGEQQKIRAEVKVPQSRFEYVAQQPPVIETPQLRDMGEATPPLEWIGLHREKMPNLMHQIVIVSLLELAGEVEDGYFRILGSS